MRGSVELSNIHNLILVFLKQSLDKFFYQLIYQNSSFIVIHIEVVRGWENRNKAWESGWWRASIHLVDHYVRILNYVYILYIQHPALHALESRTEVNWFGESRKQRQNCKNSCSLWLDFARTFQQWSFLFHILRRGRTTGGHTSAQMGEALWIDRSVVCRLLKAYDYFYLLIWK